jgi:hypothetical protein
VRKSKTELSGAGPKFSVQAIGGASGSSPSLETLVEKRILSFRESAEKLKEDLEALRR